MINVIKKAAAYLRKSTSGRDEDGCERQSGSFDRQKMAIMDYARRNGIEIIRWYEEPASGKSIRKRSVFLRMVKEAESILRPFEIIIFDSYDRYMRSNKEAMRYEVLLDDLGIELHFTNLRNDGSPADEIYKSLARQMSADYSKDLARKVVQGMIRKAKMGSWLGGPPPYGYRKTKDTNGCVWLTVHEPEAKVVRMIFEQSLKGHGHKAIAIMLNEQGILSSEIARNRNSVMNQNPDGRWCGDTVRYILRNPVYRGVVRWNRRGRVDCFSWRTEGRGTVEIGKLRTETASFRKNGDKVVNRAQLEYFVDRVKPKEEWVVIEGKAPPIIKAEDFETVQRRFHPYSSKKWRRMNSTKYLMSSVLTCKMCGNRFFGHRYKKTIKSTGEQIHYEFYRCAGEHKKGAHLGTKTYLMLKQKAIDDVVMQGIQSRIQNLVRPDRVKELFEQRLQRFIESNPDHLLKVEKELKSITNEIDRMIYAFSKFETPMPDDKIRELRGRQKALEATRDGLIAAGHSSSALNIETEVEQFLERLASSQKAIAIGNPQERIQIREAFLAKAEVFWYNSRPEVRFFWRKVPKVATGSNTGHLHHFNSELARRCRSRKIRYRGGELVLVES